MRKFLSLLLIIGASLTTNVQAQVKTATAEATDGVSVSISVTQEAPGFYNIDCFSSQDGQGQVIVNKEGTDEVVSDQMAMVIGGHYYFAGAPKGTGRYIIHFHSPVFNGGYSEATVLFVVEQ